MKYVMSWSGRQSLKKLSTSKTLYAFDFDGTLSPIVSNPNNAKAPKHTFELIRELSRLAPVAIISGRSLSDLKGRFKNVKCQLIGNHGIEGLKNHSRSALKANRVSKKWRQQLEVSDSSVLIKNGVFIEDKDFSLALHYRNTSKKKWTRLQLIKEALKLSPLPRLIPGKDVLNLTPQEAPHKGTALLKLIKELKLNQAFYIGDDDTDEDVFSLTSKKIVSVRVGNKKTSKALFYIKKQSDIDRLISLLIEQIRSDKNSTVS